jgi:hypothetical protein
MQCPNFLVLINDSLAECGDHVSVHGIQLVHPGDVGSHNMQSGRFILFDLYPHAAWVAVFLAY